MTNHQLIFNKIKELLFSHFPERVLEIENGNHLVLESENENESSIWINLDEDDQLIVGYGLGHIHYFPEFDDLNVGFNRFLNFLTCSKKRTEYIKGKFHCRIVYEFKNENGAWENYATIIDWFYPFWKKTKLKTTIQKGFISYEEIESDIEAIKRIMNN